MNHSFYQEPCWCHALTLEERLASLRAVQSMKPDSVVNVDLAQRRLQQWRSQPPFSTGNSFAQRLAADGLSEEELCLLLGEPIEAVRDRLPIPPLWLAELADAFSRPPAEPLPLSEAMRDQAMSEILDMIEPLISQGRDRLGQGVRALQEAYSELPLDAATVEEILFANLPAPLIARLSRTMALELNIARLRGLLDGDTPEERFRSFVAHVCRRDTTLLIFQEYPVLARQLMLCINHWVDFSLEFLQHLCTDWETIRGTFTPDHDPGVLVQLSGGAGDSHRNGRSVLIARFSSGFQVVYKPRSLAVDVHFQELLTWINERGDHPAFQTLKVLDYVSHGWVEFISAQSCTIPDEVRRFYERQGGYLALLYALEATDFHHENLIAAGEHPMLLDLEALFHPRVGGTDPRHAEEIAGSALGYSVLGVGLLPARIWSNAEGESIDLSGLGAPAGQLTPHGVPRWDGAGTDEMRLIRKRAIHPGADNRPSLNGTDVDVIAYEEAIIAGFTKIYRLLLNHRTELLAENGPLARFAGAEVRVILRNTRTYDMLQYESFHPDVLRDALDRDRLLDRLWGTIEQRPYLAKVIPAERQELLNGDIPVFTARPDSADIWSGSGERIADFFDEPGMTLVQRRMERLSDADLAQQLWFIRASLVTLIRDGDRAPGLSYNPLLAQGVPDKADLLAGARAVGDRLEALAIQGEHDISWIGLTLESDRYWSLTPLETDLYDGLAGVTLFLAYLGTITDESRYTLLAQSSLVSLRRQIERAPSLITGIGGFAGWGGIIYLLTHLSVLWDQPALIAEAEVIVERLPDLIERDEQLDVIGGAAGCIAGLLSLYRCSPSESTLAAATRCGNRLVAHIQSIESASGNDEPSGTSRFLAGFSHGAAGMAWWLLELAALTRDERYRAAALAAIDYERRVFSPEAGNWPDLRELDGELDGEFEGVKGLENRFMIAWCHGAVGIGMARLCSLRHLDDAQTRAEIDTALHTTLARGFGYNHSLCHGDLGNLELLLQASQKLDDPQWRPQVDRIASNILESINKNGWRCGIPLGVESPGLMTGIAGIGYGLLRLVEPMRVPSVLLLEPPLRPETISESAGGSAVAKVH